jgi:outer membrane protein OmpA-like peptidoglycan-associated protein
MTAGNSCANILFMISLRRFPTNPAIIASLLALATSCTTNPYTGEQQASKAGLGALAGGLAGAGIGALTGDDSKERRQRALIGAGIGAIGGGLIGNYMDQQEAQLRAELRNTGVQVVRKGDQLILVMPGNITFETDRDEIRSGFIPVLISVTKVLKEFNQTVIDLAGHTDSTGSRAHNMDLSTRRAYSVSDFLRSQGVREGRLDARGYGPDYPIASNNTAAGRQQNRRAELSLRPIGN